MDVKSWAGLDSLHAQHLKPPLWALYLPSCQSLKVCSQPHLHNDDLTFGGKACETHALFCSKVQGNESLLFVLFLSLKLFSNLQSDTFFSCLFFESIFFFCDVPEFSCKYQVISIIIYISAPFAQSTPMWTQHQNIVLIQYFLSSCISTQEVLF